MERDKQAQLAAVTCVLTLVLTSSVPGRIIYVDDDASAGGGKATYAWTRAL